MSESKSVLEEVEKSIPRDGSLGKFVKAKLEVLKESFETESQLLDLANSVIAFLSREYGECLPGEYPEMDALLAKAEKAREASSE